MSNLQHVIKLFGDQFCSLVCKLACFTQNVFPRKARILSALNLLVLQPSSIRVNKCRNICYSPVRQREDHFQKSFNKFVPYLESDVAVEIDPGEDDVVAGKLDLGGDLDAQGHKTFYGRNLRMVKC